MEKVIENDEVQASPKRQEASQKAMIGLVALTGVLCLATVCGVFLFATILRSL